MYEDMDPRTRPETEEFCMKDAVDETDGPHNEEYAQNPREEEGLDAIKQLKDEVLERLDIIYSQFEEYFKNLDGVKKEVENVKEDAKRREERLLRVKNEMEMEKAEEKKAKKSVERNFEKIDNKIEDIMSEVGYGESLDVSKIPPNILEIVYQSTLDDLVGELWKSLGPGDFERVIIETLEEVRLMTSGSELFRFDNNRRIRTNNLAKSLSEGLISAKQIQTTYDVLLDKLTEYIPYHKAKNFRAMIKIKSQEYTVDKTSFLLEKVDQMEKRVNQTNQLVAALSAQLNAKGMQMDRVARDIEKKMYLRYDSAISDIRKEVQKLSEEKIGGTERNELTAMVREIRDGQEGLRNEIDSMKVMSEMKDGVQSAKIDMLVRHLDLEEKADSVAETITSRKRLSELDEESVFIYYAVPESEDGAMTAAAMAKKLTGVMDKDIVKERIKTLADDRFIFEKKKGKTVRYYRPAGGPPEAAEGQKGETDTVEEAAKEIKELPAADEVREAREEEGTIPTAEEKNDLKKADIEKKKEGVEEKKKGKKSTRKPRKGKGKKAVKKEEKKEEAEEEQHKKADEKAETAEGKKEEKAAPVKEKKKKERESAGKEAKKEPETEEKEEIGDVDEEILKKVLEILPEENGLTMARIRGEAKGIKYTDILMGIKMLIDRGEATAVQSGRRTLYKRVKKNKKEKKEDKGD